MTAAKWRVFSERVAQAQQRFNRLPRWPLALVAAAAPALMTLLLLAGHLHVDWTQFVPSYHNDQTGYCHCILTFSEAGFNGGYYTAEEKPAALDFIHFDVYGPFFPIIYGTIAHFTGWAWYHSILLNMALVGLALLAFIRLARLDSAQIVLTGIISVTFWPLLLFLPTCYQESFHHAIAIVTAGLFYNILSKDGQISRRFAIGMMLWLFAAALVRISWTLLYFPFFLFTSSRPVTPRSLFMALVKGGAFVLAVLVVNRYTYAPGLNSVATVIEGFHTSVSEGFDALVRQIRFNFENYALVLDWNIHLSQKAQLFGLLALAAVSFGVKLWHDRGAADRRAFRETAFHLFNLLSILAAGLTLYLVEGYYRIFSVPLLLTALLLAAFKRRLLVTLFVTANLLTIGSFFEAYRDWEVNFTFDPVELAALKETIGQHVVYRPDAPNGWCNTVLIPLEFYDYRVTLIPAGIGVSYLLDRPPTLPIKSLYLLFNDSTYESVREQLNVERLASLPFGTLYYNNDSACPPPGSP